MPATPIGRHTAVESVAATAALATTEAIDISDYAGGVILTPAVLAAASLTIYASNAADGTYVQLYEVSTPATPTALTLGLGTSRAIPLPNEVYAVHWLKLVLNTGTATLTLCMKG